MITELNRLLAGTGLADESGKLLYSGINTVKSGDLYVLGFNPGGDPDEELLTVQQHLNETPPDFNEFIDGCWGAPDNPLPPGSAVLQKRIQWMLSNLGYDVRKVCASNLIFARSAQINALHGNRNQLADACWPVHEFIMKKVRPKAIIALGNLVFDAIRNRTTKNTIVSINSGHGNWKIRATEIEFEGRKISLVAPPHLSRYKFDNHPNEFAWLKMNIG